MEDIGVAIKEIEFEPEEKTFDEDEIEEIQFVAFDKAYRINYSFEYTNQDHKQYLSFGLQVGGKENLFPFYSIIKIKIYSDSTIDNQPYKFIFPITLSSLYDNNKIKPLRTEIPLSECYKWSFMKIIVKCKYFPYQKIPTGLNSTYSLCYLNSIIQMLYNIPKFRQIIFSYPIKDVNQKPCPILLALQRLFSQMSINNYKFNSSNNEHSILNDFVPSALELAESFGWTHDDLVEEQDAYEFLTIFLDKLQALLLPFPDLSEQLNMLFNGEFICNSKIEDFSSFSVPLSKDLNHSLDMCVHPNCKENYAKLYFAIDKFIDFANTKAPMPSEFQILADELISMLNKTSKSTANDIEYNENSADSTEKNKDNNNNQNNNLNSKSVSFDFNNNNNNCNQIVVSVYRILRNELNNSTNQCCQKLALALKSMSRSGQNAQYPSKVAKILSERLFSINHNTQPNNSSYDDIAKLICDFYLDEQIKKMSNSTNYFVKLPQVLILQIRRFNEENGEIKKSNQSFQFPETLSMNDFIDPQNRNVDDPSESDYELQSVISHRGELNKGHYVEFSRPTNRGKYWFKFDEKNVSIVSKNEAINGNFGDNTSIMRSLSLGAQKQPTTPPYISRVYSTTFHENQANKLNPKSLVTPKPSFITSSKSVHQKDSIVQPLSAYILVYVRKKSVKEIIDTDVIIPDKLKITKIETTAPIVVPASPKVNIIRMIKSDDLSKLIKTNHFCMKDNSIFDKCTIVIDRKQVKLETIWDLYKYVKDKVSGFFLLWRCTHGFCPTKPLTKLDQKLTDAITSYFDTFILIQETGKEDKIERPLCIDDSLFYLLFFDPFDPDNFVYLGLVEFNIDKSIVSIFEIIKSKLNNAKICKHKEFSTTDDEIAVFYENENQSAIYLSPSSSDKGAFNFNNSSNLIVQFAYKVPHYNDLAFSDDYSLCNSFSHKDGESYTKLLMNVSTTKYPFNPLFIDYYYKMKYDSFDVTFHRISTSDHVTLKVPKKASIGELSRVLFCAFYEKEYKRCKESALLKMQPFSSRLNEVTQLIQNNNNNISNDNSQIVVSQQNVLVQFFYSCQRILYPATMPIQAEMHSPFRVIVPQFQQSLDLFFEFFPPYIFNETSAYKQPKVRPYVTARFEISENAITSNKIYQVVIDNGHTTYADVSRMIGIDINSLQTDEMTNSTNATVYRILMILKGKIVKIVTNYNDRISENDCKSYVFRFEIVPEKQKKEANTIKVRVHYGIRINSSEVKLFGIPFYFAFNRGENENTIIQRIKSEYMKFMKPDEKTEFVITNGQLKIIKESIESLTNSMIDDPNRCICILMNGRIHLKEIIAMEKASSSKQLKIYT